MVRRAEARELVLSPRPDGVPWHRWIYEEIRRGILEGRLRAGTRLPATRDLASQYGLARGTVAYAFEELTAEGYVSGRIGCGTFVLTPIPETLLHAKSKPTAATVTHLRKATLAERGRELSRTPFPVKPPTVLSRPFRAAQPDVMEFPLELWRKIAARRSRVSNRFFLADGEAQGFLPLREAISCYLSTARGISCSRDQVVILGSVQQALDLSVRLLLNPGQTAWLENPGYQGARQILQAGGVRVVPVPVDSNGIDVATGIRLAPAGKLAYVTPARQAPLGMPLTLARRMALLQWAKQAGAWIFEDDYDGEYRFTGRPRAALKSLDNEGCVIYAGTFSKLLFPSLRLAYVVLPDRLIEPFVSAVSLTMRHVPLMSQVVLSDFISEGHFGRHIRRMRALYSERADALQRAAQQYWAGAIEVPRIEAGLDVAARFVIDADDIEVANLAARAGVETRPLSRWFVEGKRGGTRWRGLVLGFATTPPASIKSGAQSLARVLNSC